MAATVEEPRKQRTARVDWAGLLRRTFALDGLRLSAVWRQAKGAGVCEGPRWGALDIGPHPPAPPERPQQQPEQQGGEVRPTRGGAPAARSSPSRLLRRGRQRRVPAHASPVLHQDAGRTRAVAVHGADAPAPERLPGQAGSERGAGAEGLFRRALLAHGRGRQRAHAARSVPGALHRVRTVRARGAGPRAVGLEGKHPVQPRVSATEEHGTVAA